MMLIFIDGAEDNGDKDSDDVYDGGDNGND